MTVFETKTTRYYSQEDVQQILHLAIARQADDKNKEFSYEQLLEIASELEISIDSLKIAESDWLTQQGEMQQRLTFNTYRRSKFKKRLGKYVIVNSVLLLVNLLSSGGLSSALYILLFWGLAVCLDGWNSYHISGEDYEVAFRKWQRKHQAKKFLNTFVDRWFKAWRI